METIICQTCGQEKPKNEFKRIGGKRAPALCVECFRRKKQEYDKARWNEKRTCKNEIERRRNYAVGYNHSSHGKNKAMEYRKRQDVIDRMKAYHKQQKTKDKAKCYRKRPDVKHRQSMMKKGMVDAVGDSYVKVLIRQKTSRILTSKDIPKELIELQRKSLILKRAIKQKQQEDEQRTTTDV